MSIRKVAEVRMTTDPDSILQLGIEAARDGNKEEARNLFRLLTREDSQNVQAWLWLAGVAESREERQAALERVVELDPQNSMALKSLESLKAETTGSPPAEQPKQPDVKEAHPAAPVPQPSPPPSRTAPEDDFDDPFAELDSLSDIFSEDPRAVGREQEEEEPSEESSQDATVASVSGRSAGAAGASTSSTTASASTGTDTNKSTRKTTQKKSPYISQPPLAKSSWTSAASAASSSSSSKNKSKSDPLALLSGANMRFVLGGVAGILIIAFLWFLVWPRVSSLVQGRGNVAGPSAPQQEQPAVSQTENTPIPAMDSGTTPEQELTAEAPVPVTVPEAPVPAPETQPTAPPINQTDLNVDAMNPAIIPENTPLESNGWLYDYNQSFCIASCTVVFRGNVAGSTPQGRFVQVLVVVVNRTGQEQPIPADFFVLKDAQGRVYKALPELSKAFVMPGVNADRSHLDPVPPNGITTSVALFFDIASDATQVVLFSPTRPDQGWMVLERVQ